MQYKDNFLKIFEILKKNQNSRYTVLTNEPICNSGYEVSKFFIRTYTMRKITVQKFITILTITLT